MDRFKRWVNTLTNIQYNCVAIASLYIGFYFAHAMGLISSTESHSFGAFGGMSIVMGIFAIHSAALKRLPKHSGAVALVAFTIGGLIYPLTVRNIVFTALSGRPIHPIDAASLSVVTWSLVLMIAEFIRIYQEMLKRHERERQELEARHRFENMSPYRWFN